MTYVVAYDVADDDRRSRLAALLQQFGDRIQLSVFMVTIDPSDMEQLVQRAERLLEPEEDSLYCLVQCADCRGGMRLVGQANPPEPVLYWAAL